MVGSAKRPTTGRSPSPKAASGSDGDEEEFDLEAFQAEIDASVQASRALVESWTPKNLGPQWQYAPQEETGERGLQQVKDRARPPRLGLGATVASAHKQLAEDRKIRTQLLGKKRPAIGDAGSNVKALTATMNGGSDDDEDDNDEEESRSKAVGKGKGNGTAAPNGLHGTKKDYSNPFVIPKATSSMPNAKAAVHAAADTGGKALFNDPSPTKPVASPTSTATKSDKGPLVAASAFYGGNQTGSAASDAVASTSTTALTKNQRKKERQREKVALLKRQREEESRQEELAEQDRAKRARVESEAVAGKAADPEPSATAAQADLDEGDDAAGDVSRVSGAGGPSSPGKEGQVNGGASPAGKRKKKKKKKAAAGAAAADTPLLNL